jgi:hypothetical protein
MRDISTTAERAAAAAAAATVATAARTCGFEAAVRSEPEVSRIIYPSIFPSEERLFTVPFA